MLAWLVRLEDVRNEATRKAISICLPRLRMVFFVSDISRQGSRADTRRRAPFGIPLGGGGRTLPSGSSSKPHLVKPVCLVPKRARMHNSKEPRFFWPGATKKKSERRLTGDGGAPLGRDP